MYSTLIPYPVQNTKNSQKENHEKNYSYFNPKNVFHLTEVDLNLYSAFFCS